MYVVTAERKFIEQQDFNIFSVNIDIFNIISQYCLKYFQYGLKTIANDHLMRDTVTLFIRTAKSYWTVDLVILYVLSQ